ncbi:patatin-like phospholipase RssA [Gallaecimonas sp. GXIMD4217]|uniref:patatin-like phospholipase RssA n=1 Tax=Gallaecimonas sp. GXIMD4217 TaxID=3131927 RepID=UPI00311B2D91
MTAEQRPKLGLALGSGAAKGWAHIGVIKALEALGIRPDIVAGCSVGSLVGAAYCAGHLDQMEGWVRGFSRLEVMSLLDPSLNGRGLFHGEKVFNVVRGRMQDRDIRDLPIPFAAVATDLDSGREIWLQEGDVTQAIRASCGMPGLFVPVRHNGHLLVDGAVVNPVPVSLCRAMGADVVIAVNLTGDVPGHIPTEVEEEVVEDAGYFRQWFNKLRPEGKDDREELPSMWNVMSGAINIMQERITRARLAGDPPEVELKPRLSDINIMEFYRAGEAIAEGEACVQRMADYILAELQYLGVATGQGPEAKEA